VLTFIYTRCPLPDFCPLMDRHFAHLQKAIDASPALRGRVHLVSITVDPAFDTPAVLRKHAAELGANPAVWTFLTGEGTDVKTFAGSLGVFVSRAQGEDGPITHNLRTAIVDPQGRLAKIYDGNDWTPDQILHDLGPIVAETHAASSTR
jgi:protein SCO1/2